MKTKITLLLIAVALHVDQSWAQLEINIPPASIECPGEAISYSAFPVSTGNQGCTYNWTVTNGIFSNGQTTFSGDGNSGLAVTVTWNNVQASSNSVAPKGALSVTVSGCALPSGEKVSDTENNISPQSESPARDSD